MREHTCWSRIVFFSSSSNISGRSGGGSGVWEAVLLPFLPFFPLQIFHVVVVVAAAYPPQRAGGTLGDQHDFLRGKHQHHGPVPEYQRMGGLRGHRRRRDPWRYGAASAAAGQRHHTNPSAVLVRHPVVGS